MPFAAKTASNCTLCNEIIEIGSKTVPILVENDDTMTSKGRKVNWAHEACISPDDERIPICKHWLSKGVCIYQVQCQFRHPLEARNTSSRTGRRHGTWKRNRVYNEGRVGALRRWLIRVFGLAYLQSGSGILDVAGGKGEFSFEALNLNQIPSTCVDPRPMLLSRYCKKLQYGFYHKNDILGRYNTAPVTTVPQYPTHIRTYFEMASAQQSNALGGSLSTTTLPVMLESIDAFAVSKERGKTAKWTKKGLLDQEHEEIDNEDIQYDICDDATTVTESTSDGCTSDGIEIEEYDMCVNVVRDCSVVVGMHPDQAAEHVIRFCLANQKPFAIIPCCVYSSQFPKRRHPVTGGPVKEFGHFIEYLISLDPEGGIKAAQLDFDGKNILLYYLANRVPEVVPDLQEVHVCRGGADADVWWSISRQSKKTCRCQSDCDI